MEITGAKLVILALAIHSLLAAGTCLAQQTKPRARDLGIPFEGARRGFSTRSLM